MSNSCTQTHARKLIHACANSFTLTHAQTHIHKHTVQTRAHTHTHTHTHTHANLYTYKQCMEQIIHMFERDPTSGRQMFIQLPLLVYHSYILSVIWSFIQLC